MKIRMMKKIAIFLLLTTAFLYAEDEDAIKELLLSQDEMSYKYHETITYITRVNMGIPGGDNWLVSWRDIHSPLSRSCLLILYSINNNEVMKKVERIVDSDMSIYTEYDIMKDIPGKRVGNGVSAIADLNGDGSDEIFTYAFGGIGHYIYIGIGAAAVIIAITLRNCGTRRKH